MRQEPGPVSVSEPDWATNLTSQELRDPKSAIWKKVHEFTRGLIASRVAGVPREDQEEMTQEAVVKVFMFCCDQSPENIRKVAAKAVGWVVGTYWERRRVRDRVSTVDPQELERIEDEAAQVGMLEIAAASILAEVVMEAIRVGQPLAFHVMRLRFYEELDFEEIGLHMGIPSATARKRWERAQLFIKKLFNLDPELSRLLSVFREDVE